MAYEDQYKYHGAETSWRKTPRVPAKNHRSQQPQSPSYGLETEKRFQQQQGYSNPANYDNYGSTRTTYNDSYGDQTKSRWQQQGHRNPGYYNVENGNTNVDDGKSRAPGLKPGLTERVYGKMKAAKDFVMGNKSSTSSTFSEGPGNVIHVGRDVHVLTNAGKPSTDKAEDLKCSQMKVFQPTEPTGQYMKDVFISWTLPKPKYCKVARLQFTIRNDVGYVWGKKSLYPTDTQLKIPDKTIECGSNYYAYITTMVRRDNEDYETYDTDETVFYTRPGRPTCLRLECTEYTVDVHWAPCSGAEQFGISLLEDETKRKLDYQVTPGSTHSCTFKIDKKKGVYLGKHYNFEVVAIRGKWRNKTEDRLFLGSHNSPQSVKAALNAESNKVLLSWRKPESSYRWQSNTYVVEVLPESGEAQEQLQTTNTTMDITDLKGGTSYSFRVATLGDGDAKSLWSLSNTIKTEACTIKVENFRLETNDEDPSKCIDCFWDSVEGAEGYKIRYKRPGNSTTVVALDKVATQYTVKDLLPNTEYQVSIKAKDGKGYGPYMEEERKSTGLGRPLDIKLKVVDGNNVDVAFKEAPLATSQKVALSADGEDESDSTVPLHGSKRFNDLLWNKKYHITVTAIYGASEGGHLTETILTAPAAPSSREIGVEIDNDNPTSVFIISTPIAENCDLYQARVTCLDRDEKEEDSILEMSVNKDTSFAVLEYRCLHEGAKFDIRIRAKNDTGYGQWSEQKLQRTAPKKVDNLTMDVEDGKLVAKWQNTRHATHNILRLFKDKKLVAEKRPSNSPYVFYNEPIRGMKYYCVINPENFSGRGPDTKSNKVLIPLDPPHSLTMKDAIEYVKFAWTPSTGMQSALISFRNSDLNEITDTTNHKEWASPPVTPGEAYEFKVWAKNGDTRSKKYLWKTFVTAPREVLVKRNKIRPESRLDVQIDSSHPGPFLLSWRNTAERKKGDPWHIWAGFYHREFGTGHRIRMRCRMCLWRIEEKEKRVVLRESCDDVA